MSLPLVHYAERAYRTRVYIAVIIVVVRRRTRRVSITVSVVGRERHCTTANSYRLDFECVPVAQFGRRFEPPFSVAKLRTSGHAAFSIIPSCACVICVVGLCCYRRYFACSNIRRPTRVFLASLTVPGCYARAGGMLANAAKPDRAVRRRAATVPDGSSRWRYDDACRMKWTFARRRRTLAARYAKRARLSRSAVALRTAERE